MTIAVFDVDGTLIDGQSSERGFFRWLLLRRWLGPRQLLAFLWFNLRWCRRYGRHTFKKNKAYLSGLDEVLVARLAAEYVESDVRYRLHAPCVGRLRAHLAAGDHVMLLTGTITPIARALAGVLDVQDIIATRCAVRDGLYTAAPPHIHPFGEEKRDLLQAAVRQLGNVPGPVVAYSDSGHDVPLMESVERAVCVRPDRRLGASAAEYGWEVLEARPAPAAVAAAPNPGCK